MDRQATPTRPVRLRLLLRERHWQTHRTFTAQYDQAARQVDPTLIGAGPSRAQLHRWTSGDLKGLPYPDHCRVLEKMFPGWTAEQLFEPVLPGDQAQLLETIEDRLSTPDLMPVSGWGQASRSFVVRPLSESAQVSERARLIGRKLQRLQQLRRLSDRDVARLAALAGQVVALQEVLTVIIEADGSAEMVYDFDLLNLSDAPLVKVSRELWFEHTSGWLDITPLKESERRVVIQRRHDTSNMAKFALGISPPIQPGDSARIGAVCRGGRFDGAYYWRHAVHRHTYHYTLQVRHRGIQLLGCDATEEHAEGSEVSATDGLLWDDEEDGVVMTVTRDYLSPGQALTLRWEVSHGPA